MFVCVCNGITERQIREAIDNGARSLPELTAALGVAAGCGTCADYTHFLLDAATYRGRPCPCPAQPSPA